MFGQVHDIVQYEGLFLGDRTFLEVQKLLFQDWVPRVNVVHYVDWQDRDDRVPAEFIIDLTFFFKKEYSIINDGASK